MSVTEKVLSDDGAIRVIETWDGKTLLHTRREIIPTPETVNEAAIRATALQALAANRAFVGTATPTAAQTTAQVKALTRQVNALARLLLGQLDGTD